MLNLIVDIFRPYAYLPYIVFLPEDLSYLSHTM